jgi:hypothetical protein
MSWYLIQPVLPCDSKRRSASDDEKNIVSYGRDQQEVVGEELKAVHVDVFLQHVYFHSLSSRQATHTKHNKREV